MYVNVIITTKRNYLFAFLEICLLSLLYRALTAKCTFGLCFRDRASFLTANDEKERIERFVLQNISSTFETERSCTYHE